MRKLRPWGMKPDLHSHRKFLARSIRNHFPPEFWRYFQLNSKSQFCYWEVQNHFDILSFECDLLLHSFSYLGIYWFFSVPVFWKFKVKFLGVGLLSSIVLSILSVWKLTSFSSENFYWTISLMISSFPFFLLSFSVLLLFG